MASTLPVYLVIYDDGPFDDARGIDKVIGAALTKEGGKIVAQEHRSGLMGGDTEPPLSWVYGADRDDPGDPYWHAECDDNEPSSIAVIKLDVELS